mgnify:CR=1 FL=1
MVKKTTINELEEKGVLRLFEKRIETKDGTVVKYFATIPNSDLEFEIAPTTYKSMTE